MYRIYPFVILFLTTALLQVFLFDNLSVSIYLDPLVYVAFVLLLPLDIRPVTLLGAGLAMGWRWTSRWVRRGSTRCRRC